MERIRNIYCWNHLGDWAEALNNGIVHMAEAEASGKEMFRWEQLMNMIYKNCFPQSFLCFRQGNQNYLILTEEQKKIFEFLNDEILLQEKDGAQYRFSDFAEEFRNKILNTQIDSIWIRLDNSCDLKNFLKC